MATVLDIATAALREIGVLAAGESPTADDSSAALDALNNLIDQWAAERLAIYTVTRTTKALTSGTASYTVGSGGDIGIVRPVYLDHVTLIDTAPDPDSERPLDPLTEDQYAALSPKALQATYPTAWYWNPTFSTARGTLTLWPVPTGSGLHIALYVPTAVPEFTATSDTVSLPPGYRRMLIKNLALELAASYSRAVDPDLRAQAADAKAVVKRANRRISELAFTADSLVQGSRMGAYDILTDRML
jgi:hypothetical protein